MTNTINNVPRELLRDIETHLDNIAEFDPTYAPETVPLNNSAELLIPLRALLSAQSPAGVDGWDVAGDILEKLSAAQAIIDGLRGEVERSKSFAAGHVLTNERISAKLHTAETERDQQAQRIGELEGLLRACHSALYPFDNKVLENEIDSALSTDKKGE